MGYTTFIQVSPIIDSIVRSKNFDTTNAMLVFECTDGYQPAMDYSKLFGPAEGFLVYKDLNEDISANPSSIGPKFQPYYLVWDNVKKDDDSFIWPFGVTGMKLISKSYHYRFMYPLKDQSLMKGFNFFINHCIKCHSINKTGGTKGPELNVPKNITEYWKEEDIISFAKNSKAYRYNSKMPAIANLKHADFAEIIAYLKYMKNHKLQN